VETQCPAPSKPQRTTWNGRSGIWRHNYSVRMACPTAKTTRIKLTRPNPRPVNHCNDAISLNQVGPRPRRTQARSLSARDGEDSSRPASASEVDLDARPCADRRQFCNANLQLIGWHHSAVQGCRRTLTGLRVALNSGPCASPDVPQLVANAFFPHSLPFVLPPTLRRRRLTRRPRLRPRGR